MGRRSVSHSPALREGRAPLDLANAANPTSAHLRAPPRDDALGSSDPAPESRRGEGQSGSVGWSEEGSLLLELIPLPQSQLAKLFRRHGEHPGEVLG